jgi:copper chaperone
MEKIVLNIEGMSCEHCVKAVYNALDDLAGVENIDVSLKEKTVSFEYDPAQTPLKSIELAITEEGYTVL